MLSILHPLVAIAMLCLSPALVGCDMGGNDRSRERGTTPASGTHGRVAKASTSASREASASPGGGEMMSSPGHGGERQQSCAWGDPEELGWSPAVCRALTKAEGVGDHRSEADAGATGGSDAGQAPGDDGTSPEVVVSDAGARRKGADGACPPEMIHVRGMFCPKRRFRCIKWIEDPSKNPFARCRAYEKPSKCSKSEPRRFMEFCIDRYEAAGPDGLPLADKSWNQARKLCAAQGKRLCKESEWTFACEGEEGRPYPYGYVRNNEICNFEITKGLIDDKGMLADHRQPVTANPKCVSPFGVQNMVGNIDEWVVLDHPYFSHRHKGKKMMSGLKGGWWGPLRNRCRPVTVDHDEVFHELQTGFRCCRDVNKPGP